MRSDTWRLCAPNLSSHFVGAPGLPESLCQWVLGSLRKAGVSKGGVGRILLGNHKHGASTAPGPYRPKTGTSAPCWSRGESQDDKGCTYVSSVAQG